MKKRKKLIRYTKKAGQFRATKSGFIRDGKAVVVVRRRTQNLRSSGETGNLALP